MYFIFLVIKRKATFYEDEVRHFNYIFYVSHYLHFDYVFSAFHCTCTVTQRTINPAVEVPNVHKLL